MAEAAGRARTAVGRYVIGGRVGGDGLLFSSFAGWLATSFGSSALSPASTGRLADRMRTVPGGVVGGVTMDEDDEEGCAEGAT